MTRVLVVGRDDHTLEFSQYLRGADTRRIESADLDSAAPEPCDVVVDLTIDNRLSANSARAARPTLVFVSALVRTATMAFSDWGGVPVASIGWLPRVTGLSDRIEMAPSLQLDSRTSERARATLESLLGRTVEVAEDRIGLVSARVLATVINEAAFAMMEGVATAEDIDMAMKLGTNYPRGPLEWADEIGPDVIVALLEALHDEYREERYRACVLLRQYARAGRAFRVTHRSSSL